MAQVVTLRFCTTRDYSPEELEAVRKALKFAVEEDNYDPLTGVDMLALPVGTSARDWLDLGIAHEAGCWDCGPGCAIRSELQLRYENALLNELPDRQAA